MCLPSESMEDRAQSALRAVTEFSALAGQVKHEELRCAALKVAHEALAQCEGLGQGCVRFLLDALKQSTSFGAAAQDAVWMLYKVARRSDTARAWILEAGGLQVLLAAMEAQPGRSELLETGIWTAYALAGVRGFAQLLGNCHGCSPGQVGVRAGICWAVYQLTSGGDGRGDFWDGRIDEIQPAHLIALLIGALRLGGLDRDTLWACCSALDTLVAREARFGTLLVQSGGAQVLVGLLRSEAAAGPEAVELRQAIACLMSSLADGNSHAAEMLSVEGATKALANEGLQGTGKDAEAAMWALGALDGLEAVLQAMKSSGLRNAAVLSGGVQAISDCAHQVGDRGELARLPAALSVLLELLGLEENNFGGLKACMRALGCVLSYLAPHAPPGRVSEVDRGMQVLLTQLQRSPTNTSSAGGDGGVFKQCPVAAATESAAEAVGRIAMVSPDWRGVMQTYALEPLIRWIRCGSADRRLHKYLFWAAASISGLPFVISEMRLHMDCTDVVDASICTVIDILDEDIDGEYALAGAERASESDLPSLMGLVIDAMKAHAASVEIQARGAACLALLVPLVSREALRSVTPTLITVVLNGARRFPRRQDVAHGACCALRALCTLPRLRGAIDGSLEAALATALRAESAADCVDQVLQIFGSYEDSAELLEDAVAVMALLKGVETVLQLLLETDSALSPLRVAGLKALFELGSNSDSSPGGSGLSSERFSAATAQAVHAACENMAAAAREEHRKSASLGDSACFNGSSNSTNILNRLSEVASLLSGLCSRFQATGA